MKLLDLVNGGWLPWNSVNGAAKVLNNQAIPVANTTARDLLTPYEDMEVVYPNGNKEYWSGTTWIPRVFGGAVGVEPRQLANERNIGTSNQYGASVEEWNYTIWAHDDGDTVISSAPALLKAVIVVSVLTGDVGVRDGTTAAGTLLFTASADKDFYGIKCNTGIFADDNATAGSVMFVWRPQ